VPLSVSERHDSEFKQLSVAIGMAKNELLSSFGREVDIVWWTVAAKPHRPSVALHSTRLWLTCSWIVI